MKKLTERKMLQVGRLPDFTLQEYRALLFELLELAYKPTPMAEFRSPVQGKAIYLRHDIDLHLAGVEAVAEIETSLGVVATYYVPLSLHFNPLFPPNREIIEKLVGLGHAIGLHYDLETYPRDADAALAYLRWELDVLERIAGTPVRTLCMHQPFRGEPDPFRELDDLIHPHDPRFQQDLMYVSDSCRAWRDEALLRVAGPAPPRRLLLATHPEVWLGHAATHRLAFLDETLVEHGAAQHRDYFTETVRGVWTTHSAALAHDEREARKKIA